MKRARFAFLLLSAACCLLPAPGCLLPVHAQTRPSSDFEIARMEKQLAQSRDFLSQLSGHLNLGDLRLSRGENARSRAEYLDALALAEKQRMTARAASNLSQYATATAYAGLAKAKLGDARASFALFEEAIRYAGDDAKSWNLYSSAMSLLGLSAKATSAARSAVAIAERENGVRLDLDVYRYTLAATLPSSTESEQLLSTVIADLQSTQFDSLRKAIAKSESFEIYSSARGDVAAYLSLLNRARLRLGALYEARGEIARARSIYAEVLKDRNDEPAALAAIARLSRSESDYAAAFDANPFSIALMDDYLRFAQRTGGAPVPSQDTLGGRIRSALRGDVVIAKELASKYPDNAAIAFLLERISRPLPVWLHGGSEQVTATPDELRALLTHELTPEERAALDRLTLTATAVFEPGEQGALERGMIGGVPFHFSEPMKFNGSFEANQPLHLTFRLLGVSNGSLLVEPIRLEPAR